MSNRQLVLDPAVLRCVFQDVYVRWPREGKYIVDDARCEGAVRGVVAGIMALTGLTPFEALMLVKDTMRDDVDAETVNDWVQEFGYLLEDFRKEYK